MNLREFLTPETLAIYTQRCHDAATAKGWHDQPLSAKAHLALIATELAEALEIYRRRLATVRENDPDTSPWARYAIYEIYWYNPEIETELCCLHSPEDIRPEVEKQVADGYKLQGIPIELADAAMRMFDYCGQFDHSLRQVKSILFNERQLFPDFIFDMTSILVCCEVSKINPSLFIALIALWLNNRAYHLDELIDLKLHYNTLRPHHHGNKRC